MAARSYKGLGGWVDDSQAPGLVEGAGESLVAYLGDQRRAEQAARGAENFPAAAAARAAAVASREKVGVLRCRRCKREASFVSDGLCDVCDPHGLVTRAPEQVTCGICAGRGTIDVPEAEPIDKPRVGEVSEG